MNFETACSRIGMNITVRILPPCVKGLSEEGKLKINVRDNSTIYDLFTELYRSYLLPEKRYNEYLGWIHRFWNYVVLHNGRSVGYFDKNGLKLSENLKLKEGDCIEVFLINSGG